MTVYSKLRSVFVLGVAASVLAGCTINPTPAGFGPSFSSNPQKKGKIVYKKDFTLQIIEQVRCEIRDALVSQAAALIEESNHIDPDFEYSKDPINPNVSIKVADLKEKPWEVKDLKNWQFDPLAFVQAYLFLGSSVGLDFTLTTTEVNKTGINPELSPSIGSNFWKLNIANQSLSATRKNLREHSEIKANISEYQTKKCFYDEDKNLHQRSKIPDMAYPARGRIDLKKTIDAFVDIVLLDVEPLQRYTWSKAALNYAIKEGAKGSGITAENFLNIQQDLISCDPRASNCERAGKCYDGILKLAGKKYVEDFYENSKKKKKSTELTDTLTFTTVISGGLSPKLTFSPGTGDFKLMNSAFDLTGNRTDEHKVIVALGAQIPETPKKEIVPIPIGGTTNAKLVINTLGKVKTKSKKIKSCFPLSTIKLMSPSAFTPQTRFAQSGDPNVGSLTSDDSKELQDQKALAVEEQLDEAIRRQEARNE